MMSVSSSLWLVESPNWNQPALVFSKTAPAVQFSKAGEDS